MTAVTIDESHIVGHCEVEDGVNDKGHGDPRAFDAPPHGWVLFADHTSGNGTLFDLRRGAFFASGVTGFRSSL